MAPKPTRRKVRPMAIDPNLGRKLAGLALVGTVLGGCCRAPRIVSQAASRGDQLLLLQEDECTGESAVVECELGPDGGVRRCQKTPLTFEE